MLKSLLVVLMFSAAMLPGIVQAQETEPAAQSTLTGVNLPSGAVRVNSQSVPAEVNEALAKLVAAGGGTIKQGATEVLAWTGGSYRKSNIPNLMKQVASNLQGTGWNYEVQSQQSDLTVFSVLRKEPTSQGVLGFFVPGDQAMVLAWTEILPVDRTAVAVANSNVDKLPGKSNSAAVDSSATTVNVEKNINYVNLMGNQMPAMPQFPTVTKKAGFLRGYVKDASGKPLQGAYIGVRATAVGGLYSGAHTETDEKGFYEIRIPWGVADLYAAGYTIDYGEGRAGMSLHPLDSDTKSFASAEGAVKNFVLLPYGITSRDNVSENPQNSGTYYGGSIYIGYFASEAGDNNALLSNIPMDSVIEITLTPDGKLFDGSEGKRFVIRKVVGYQSGFKINNIPIGQYKITARLANGRPLSMKLNTPVGTVFGMQPAETTQSATVLFYPDSAKASMVIPAYGNWKPVQITVSRP